MDRKNKFGPLIRRLRIEKRMSMGQMARSLGISTVYYSEVESCKKRPFPEQKVSYIRLGEVLGESSESLRRLARLERQFMDIERFFEVNEENEAHLALAFARRLSDNSLTDSEIQQLRAVLERE